ncbi:flagellin [Marinobacterium iners]|uniref:Flagellin n=1 Tax=Marinobacterium iners DSM 11526 TaxID=1122198 RepID=A0A1H3YHP7_9GAMM|nr:flagellin [Marinobacterium iners]SEA11139.1 flagellin [Marinobacterium iners DSM 11526]
MASVVNTNIMSLNAQNSLSRTNSSLQTAMERLSSGLRVNSAKDDAAGLAISNRMTSQIRGMTVAQRNANDGISVAQVAEGSMQTITDTLQRMRDLSVQAANSGGLSDGDKDKLNTEFAQLKEEIGRIIGNTDFNGKKVLQGSLSAGGTFQVGYSTAADNQITISVANLSDVSGLDTIMAAGTAISAGQSASNIHSVINNIDIAIQKIDTARSDLGAIQNRFSATIDNLSNAIENQSAARSRIVDADFAVETANLSRSQILQQAGTSMLAQANQAPQSVLSLLG